MSLTPIRAATVSISARYTDGRPAIVVEDISLSSSSGLVSSYIEITASFNFSYLLLKIMASGILETMLAGSVASTWRNFVALVVTPFKVNWASKILNQPITADSMKSGIFIVTCSTVTFGLSSVSPSLMTLTSGVTNVV